MIEQQTYPSDLTDEEWAIIEILIPGNDLGRKRNVDMRDVINGIFYVTRTSCPWRYVPKDYPPKSTIFYYFRKWTADGTWKNLNDELRKLVRMQLKRHPIPSAGILDSQSVKTTEADGESRKNPCLVIQK